MEIKHFMRQKIGIERVKYTLDNPQQGYKYFCAIADQMLEWKGKKYDSKPTEKVVKHLIDWAYMLEKTELDYTKGILLKGFTGRGKTFAFKVFAEFLKIDRMQFYHNSEQKTLHIVEVNARQIAGEYQDPKEGGYQVIEKYSRIPCLLINDIGTEADESQQFGNKVNVIEQILDRREDRCMLTFATTNLEKMSDKYDDRVVSRMNSLFNTLTLDHNNDFRKN